MTDAPQDDTQSQEPKATPDSLLANAEPALDFAQGKPEGFPDEFWDGEKNTANINALFDAFKNRDKIAKDLRVKLSKGEFTGKAPEDVNEYKLQLDENLSQFVPEDDPLVSKAREAAKQAGLPVDAFNKFMTPMIEAVVNMRKEAEAPPSPEDIAAAKEAELAKIGPNAKVITQAVNGWINSLTADGRITKDEAVVMQNMAYNAETLKMMNRLRSMIEPSSVPINMPVDSSSSRAEIEAKMAKAFAERNENEYQKYAKLLRELQ